MSFIRKQVRIGKMTCVNCQNKIEQKLRSTVGVTEAAVSYNKGTALITYDTDQISLDEITAIIERMDYEVLTEQKENRPDVGRAVCLLIIILSLYLILQRLGLLNLLVPSKLADSGMGYGMLFVVGMLTSVHCIAMCGGINLTQCLPDGKVRTIRPSLLYNLGRVSSYTAVGFILGFVGMVISGGSGTGLPVLLQGVLKLIAGFFMVIMGINMLGIFPWLRRFQLRMPRFLAIRINKEKRKYPMPFAIGLLNGLMPCGPLQSMQIVALASGNPLAGALSMLLFGLGTVPLMLGLGSVVSALGRRFTKKVMSVGAVLVIVLGLAMLSQGGSLAGMNWIYKEKVAVAEDNAEVIDGVQVVNSMLEPGNYPDISVFAGIPVKWVINAPEGSINGCNYKVILQAYGIEYAFHEGENIIEFTPEEAGTISYTCWMGMIHGTIHVLNETAAAE